MRTGWSGLAAGLTLAIAMGGVPAAAEQETQPPAEEARESAGFADARSLLEALERAADDIRTLRADIQYDRRFLLQGDRHVRRGTLYFGQREREEGGRRRVFEVDFSVLYLGERREEDRQVWTFDGRWLVEKRPDKKQFIAREVAPPGADFDPLRLGEGPIPIPIGQEAEAVLSRYEVELLPAQAGLDPEEDASLVAFVEDAWQLRLLPRSEEDDFEEIRLWYERDALLPRMAMTTNRSGDVSVVQLANVRLNEALPEDVFRITPPAIGSGWDTQIEEYRGE